MKIWDISLPVFETMPVWPGDPGVQLTLRSSLDRGDNATVTQVSMSAHAGTHVDAPRHFIQGGAGVDALDLNVLIGPALVVQATDVDLIGAALLDSLSIPAGIRRVLFHTRNSELWAYGERTFWRDYAALAEDGAKWLVDRGVRLVGIDYLSVAPFSDTRTTHRLLLGAGVILLEGLNLTGIAPGEYQLCCLPLKIRGCDGAPARAILMK